MQNEAMHIKAVVFHLEGTLIEPHKHDATSIKGPKLASDAATALVYLRS
mgnify:CR=1 FL=1